MNPNENGEVLLTSNDIGFDLGLSKYHKKHFTSYIDIEKGACGRSIMFHSNHHGNTMSCEVPIRGRGRKFFPHCYNNMFIQYNSPFMRERPKECDSCFKTLDNAVRFTRQQLQHVPKVINDFDDLLSQGRLERTLRECRRNLAENRIEPVVDLMEEMYESLYDVPGPIPPPWDEI